MATATDGSASPYRDGVDWHARWIMIFLAVGVAARLIRYLLRFPLWGDEASLVMNFLDRDYAGLMQPLDFHQVAPLLFLWIELTAVKLLGFHEWALRLFPLFCSIASLFLFHRLARLLLRGTALVLAVGIFAVTYSGLRYAAEVKPYSCDLMISTLFLLLTVRWWQRPEETGWLWALTAIVPLALGMSYAVVFVAGGVSLAVATVLLGVPSRRGWWAWAVYNMVLVGSFLAWYQIVVGSQARAELGVMTQLWDETFPPRDSLVSLLGWLAQVHAGPLLAVPLGGDHWGSIGTTLVCLVALGVLIRRPLTAARCPLGSRYGLLALLFAPFALNLIAAFLRRYPYGGHMRLTMHLAPAVSILVAIGTVALLNWVLKVSGTLRVGVEGGTRNAPDTIREPLTRPVIGVMAVLLVLVVASVARDFLLPGKEQKEIRNRDFAVWFWGSMERDHEVVCLPTDWKLTFPGPHCTWENCVLPQFACNARIYSPRLARGQPCDLGRVSRQRPLALVQFWSHMAPYDRAAFDRWLNEQKQRYDLVATYRYPMLTDNDADRVPEPADCVEVYEFVPREAAQPAS